MADYYTKASFAFAAARCDAGFLEAILEVIEDLALDLDAAPALVELSASFGERFAVAFPPIAVDGQAEVDPLSGLRGLFDDPDFPLLGLDGTTFVPRDDVTVEVMLWGGQIECDALAELIRRCCPETLAIAPVAFQAAFDCSRPRTDAYGGAAYVIFADRVVGCGTHRLTDLILADPDRFEQRPLRRSWFRRWHDRFGAVRRRIFARA